MNKKFFIINNQILKRYFRFPSPSLVSVDVYAFSEFGNNINFYDIELKEDSIENLINNKEKFIAYYTPEYPTSAAAELSNTQKVKDIIFNIDNRVVEMCNKKRAIIIVHESIFHFLSHNRSFENLHTTLEEKGIKNLDYFYYISPYLDIEDRYENWSDQEGVDKTNVVSTSMFEEFFRVNVLSNKKNVHGIHDAVCDTMVTEDEAFNSKRKKYFLLLNKVPRTHRVWLGYYMYKNNLIDKGIFSFSPCRSIASDQNEVLFDEEVFKEGCGIVSEEVYKWNKEEINKFIESTPYVADYDYNTKVIYDREQEGLGFQMTKSHYLDTYFNIVTEGTYDHNGIQLTEKICKPMLQLQPFLLVGTRWSLQKLKEFGYETFPEIFDESYDTKNDNERFECLTNEIKRLCSISLDEWDDMYHSVWDKLVHNRNLLLERNTDTLELFTEFNMKFYD